MKRLFLSQLMVCQCLAALERENVAYMEGCDITFPTRQKEISEPIKKIGAFTLVKPRNTHPRLNEVTFKLPKSIPVGSYWIAETHSRIRSEFTINGEFDLWEVAASSRLGSTVYAADWMDDEGNPEWRGFCWHSPATLKKGRHRLEMEVKEQHIDCSKVCVKWIL